MKDNFSTQASEYARFRPGYPDQLLQDICNLCPQLDHAWDCATGNGQIAARLAERFKQVEATDISEKQLAHALPAPNIRYHVAAAEHTSFPAQQFDLITVGQAAHWFDFEKFYPEVRRVLRPGGILALIGYNLLTIDEKTDALLRHLYRDVLGAYWDAERKHVDAAYQSLPFPLAEIAFPETSMTYEWTSDHLLGYLQTWSAVQHFIRERGETPLTESFISNIRALWPAGEVKTVHFPIFGRLGRYEPE